MECLLRLEILSNSGTNALLTRGMTNPVYLLIESHVSVLDAALYVIPFLVMLVTQKVNVPELLDLPE